MKRKLGKRNLALAILLSTLIFIFGLIIGNYTSGLKYGDFENTLSDLRMQTMSMELQYDLLSEDPCFIGNETYLTQELSEMNSKLDHLETLYGTSHPDIIRLKQQYSLFQIQHWMLFRNAQKKCDNLNYTLILYFYSNQKCEGCKEQGVILSAFRKKYNQEVRVYSFDQEIEDPVLVTLRQRFGVASAPSIVFNDKHHEGFVSMDDLEMYRVNNVSPINNDSIVNNELNKTLVVVNNTEG